MTILVAGFFFFLARETTARSIQNPIDVGRMPLIPLLILQGLILFGLGTGQAAAGITTEADEGVIDYQRLAPMTPFAKVLGYLFGLPIREWILFLATLPFTGYSIWKGQVPLNGVLQLYAVFFMAAILYHLTGLLAGSVMKNRRWAFLTSTGLVVFLYLIIPQAAKFGLVYLKYVTIYPVFNEVYPSFIPRPLGDAAEVFNTIIPPAKFFGLNFPQYVFTLISQGVLSLAMVMMLCRRWRKADCHLLGKFAATGLFGWLQMMLLGNALPLMNSGDLFPSRELDRRFGRLINPDIQFWSPKTWEATVMIGIYGLVTLASLWWLTFIISADQHGQVRGWRRARKLGDPKLPLLSDAATSVPWVLTMSVMGAVGWFIFGRELIDSHWYPELSLLMVTPMAMFSILLCGGLGMAALLESWPSSPLAVVVTPSPLVARQLTALEEATRGMTISTCPHCPATFKSSSASSASATASPSSRLWPTCSRPSLSRLQDPRRLQRPAAAAAAAAELEALRRLRQSQSQRYQRPSSPLFAKLTPTASRWTLTAA